MVSPVVASGFVVHRLAETDSTNDWLLDAARGGDARADGRRRGLPASGPGAARPQLGGTARDRAAVLGAASPGPRPAGPAPCARSRSASRRSVRATSSPHGPWRRAQVAERPRRRRPQARRDPRGDRGRAARRRARGDRRRARPQPHVAGSRPDARRPRCSRRLGRRGRARRRSSRPTSRARATRRVAAHQRTVAQPLAEAYRRRLTTLGRDGRTSRCTTATFVGVADEVSDEGHLVVDTVAGPREVAAGDVVHLRVRRRGSAQRAASSIAAVRLLVTGGAGFIGSNFVRYWVERHPDDLVVAYDRSPTQGNRANLDDVARPRALRPRRHPRP